MRNTLVDLNNYLFAENFDLDNLICVSRAEHLKMNQYGFYANDKDITKTGLNIVKLKDAISDKEEKYGKHSKY